MICFRYEGIDCHSRQWRSYRGGVRQPSPLVFQGNNQLQARYVVGADCWVRFVISPHDPALPVVIDPYVITGSTYLGGTLTDRVAAMTVDAAGYVYLAGSTESTDFPSGSIRPRADGAEAYVLKINPANLQVVYATYLGGTADDRALAIAADVTGSAYIAGFTALANFPAQTSFSGGSTDGFVARLSTSGTLQFATLVGGSGADTLNGIALKPDGSAWVVGETGSSNLMLYETAYQAVSRGGQDALLARINNDGSIAYTGYFGGSGTSAVAVAVDASGEVYFTGGTTSGNFPAANAYRNYNSGLQDVFVTKLSFDGSLLRYSTYLGGSGGVPGQGEVGNWIGVDGTGAALVVGTTSSNNFPVTGTAAQSSFGGGATDAFVAKISPAGTSLLYSTYFGGTSGDEGLVGTQSADGTFYFGGLTSSPGMQTTDAPQSTLGGDIDGFFVKLSNDLGAVLAFSYVGYTGTDSVSGLAVSSSQLILAGSSSSPSWLPSGGYKGLYDGWVMTLNESGLAVQLNSSPAGVPILVSGAGCSPGSATTPATLNWGNGASCTVSFSPTQGTGDTRSIFQSWADGGSANPRTIVASAGTPSYTMQFGTQHRLVRTVSPPEQVRLAVQMITTTPAHPYR